MTMELMNHYSGRCTAIYAVGGRTWTESFEFDFVRPNFDEAVSALAKLARRGMRLHLREKRIEANANDGEIRVDLLEMKLLGRIWV